MKFYTVGQAAKELRVHPNTIRRWANRGTMIEKRNYLGYRLFSEVEILRQKTRLMSLYKADNKKIIITNESYSVQK